MTNLTKKIEKELLLHILDRINDGALSDDNRDGWHFYCFNESYYLIGYYACSEWLKQHNIDTFEAIGICLEYEKDNFGEVTGIYNNSEKTVNMLAYIFGEELIYNLESETVAELKKEVKQLIKNLK